MPSQEVHELTRMLAEAKESADRVRVIVRGLMSYSRGHDERRRPVDVRHVMDDALKLAASSLGGRARVVKVYGGVPLVDANDVRLGQVFLNLLVNAFQAIGAAPAGDHEVRITTGTDARGNAVLDVSDTGAGIAASLLPRIFDPFVTTKPVDEGTGLGLFVSHAIVTGHGGEISATSLPGHGTTMHIVLRPYVPAPSM